MAGFLRWPPLLALGRFLFKYRSRVFPLILIGLLIGLPPVYPGGSAATDRLVDLVGLLIAILGQAIRALVIGFAYIKRGGLNKQVYADDLVTRGVFGVVRNPLYLGNLLILLGLFVVHGNPLVLLIGGPSFLLAYLSIVAAEEDFLHRKFGPVYASYCEDVHRWWPDVRRLPAATRDMSFDWRRVLHKDSGSAAAWIAGMCILFFYEVARTDGLAAAGTPLVLMVPMLIILVGLIPLARRAAAPPAPSASD